MQFGSQLPHVRSARRRIHALSEVVVPSCDKFLQGFQGRGVDRFVLHQRAGGAAFEGTEAAQEQVIAQLQPVHGQAGRVQLELVQGVVEFFVLHIELQE